MEPEADPKPRVVVVVQPSPPAVAPADPDVTAEASTTQAVATEAVATGAVATEASTTEAVATEAVATEASTTEAVSAAPAVPAYLPAEPWTPPVHISDRISVASRRAIRLATFLTAATVLATLVLWAIPTFRVANRPGFQAVRARAQTDSNLSWLVWEPRRIDPVPRWYSIKAGEERYELVVRGPLGQHAVIRAVVKNDKIVRFLASTEFDAHDGWRNRAFRQR